MSQAPQTIDLIRWTFTPDPDHRDEIEAYLIDLGLDVQARLDGQMVALWDEPEGNIDAVVEALWEINGSAFEVTHEEFHRLELLAYHQDGEDDAEDDRAVA